MGRTTKLKNIYYIKNMVTLIEKRVINHTLNITCLNRNLSELMDRFVQDFKSLGIPMVEGDGSNVVFPSAGELFVFYKKCMVQCSQLSTGPPLLSLAAAFQKFLREYATRVLNNHLPVK